MSRSEYFKRDTRPLLTYIILQGEKAREFLDHYKITSVDAPILVDLASDAIAATELGL